MKKRAVAVALGLLAAPVASQAQTSNVTLYGRLNLDVEVIRGKQAPDASGNQANPWVTRLSSNSSRLGVRGTESLGGGVNAIFQFESHVIADTGNPPVAGLASRETFVGLQGPWGTFRAGKFFVPYDDVHVVFGSVPTYGTTIFATSAIWGQGAQNTFSGAFDARQGNSLRWDSPDWSGFAVSTQLSLRDSSGFPDNVGPSADPANPILGGDNGDHASELRHAYVVGVAGFYNKGPIQVGMGYQANNKVRNYAVTGGQFYANDYAYTIAGGYNFGFIRPALAYEHMKYDTPTGDLKRDYWAVSAMVPAGGGVLFAFYGQASNGKGSALDGTRIGGLTKGADTGSRQYELTYTYPLSERTQVYGGYVKIDNKRNAAYSFNINPYPISTACTVSQPTCGDNGKPEGIAIGLLHLF
jgi:predicted porin